MHASIPTVDRALPAGGAGPVGDAGRRRHCPVPRRHVDLGGQRRAAHDRSRAAREHHRAGVDRRRLRARLREPDRRRRRALGPARPQADVRGRRVPVRPRLADRRPGAERRRADRCARGAGPRPGDRAAGQPGDHQRDLPRRARARLRDRPVVGELGGGAGDRPGARRRARRRAGLALGVPDQRAAVRGAGRRRAPGRSRASSPTRGAGSTWWARCSSWSASAAWRSR